MPESLLPSRTVLLLGASGKIGFEIRKALHSQAPGSKIFCCSRHPWHGPKFPNEQWFAFDPFAGAWEFPEAIDVVINAVGAIHETKEMTFDKIHLGLTELILAHRAAIGNPRIVQLSALGADSKAETSFLHSKGLADELLLVEPNVVVLRPSIVCTPNTMLSQKLRSLLKMARFSFGKLLVPTGFPFTQIQPIMGTDVGGAVAAASLHPIVPELIELVGPQRIAFGELLETMAAAEGRTVRLLEVSRDIMETFVKHFVSVWFPDLINYEQFRLLFQDNVGDVEQTKAILGRNPADTMAFWKGEAAGTEPSPSPDGLDLPKNVTVA